VPITKDNILSEHEHRAQLQQTHSCFFIIFCAANKTIIFMNEEQIPTDFLEKMMRTSKF